MFYFGTQVVGNNNVHYFTNLDLANWEYIPEIETVPRIGDKIYCKLQQSKIDNTISDNKYQLVLEVYSVNYTDDLKIEVELHLPKNKWKSLSDFYQNWYEKVTGKIFI